MCVCTYVQNFSVIKVGNYVPKFLKYLSYSGLSSSRTHENFEVDGV